MLDYSYSNFGNLVEKVSTSYPIESETNKSDHRSVNYESMLTRPAAFVWETSEYLKITTEGCEEFKKLVDREDWNDIQQLRPNIDKMTELFQEKLDKMVSRCFVWKRSRKRSTKKPWISDHIRKLEKKRLSIFRDEGRSVRWKSIDKACLLYTSPSPRD